MTNATIAHPRRSSQWLAGLGLLGLGALVLVVGLLQTTSSHGTSSCPQGTELIAKFDYEHGSYVFQSGIRNVVHISNASSKGGDASSSIAIAATVVRGAYNGVATSYSPPQTHLHFSNAGLKSSHGYDGKAEIKSVQFCKSTKPPTTTTTTEPATNPTEPTVPVTEPTTPPVTEPTTPPVTEPGTVPVTEPTTPPVTDPATSEPTESTAPVVTQPSDSSTSTSVAQEAPVVTSTTLLSSGASESGLPHTGAPSAALIVLGLVMMVLGATLAIVGRARDRRTIH